jgi:hypothetical protein
MQRDGEDGSLRVLRVFVYFVPAEGANRDHGCSVTVKIARNGPTKGDA